MNIIIGFDLREKLIKIMTVDKAAKSKANKTENADLKVDDAESVTADKKTDKKAAKKANNSLSVTTEYLHFNERIFSAQFFTEVNGLLQEHFAQKPLFAGQVAAAIQQTAETVAADVQAQSSVQTSVDKSGEEDGATPDGGKPAEETGGKKKEKKAKDKKSEKEKPEDGKSLFGGLFSKKTSFGIQPVYVVLPDEAVGFETFNLPNMRAAKLDLGVETELANEFGAKHKEKKINKFLVTHNKQYAIMGAIYYDKTIVSNVFKLLTGFRLFPKITTYSANAIMDYVYGCSPKTRGKSFIFAEMHKSYTTVVVSSKGKTLGYATIPHGVELLNSEKVENEYMRTEHEAGEIAVINAREAAKARALTTSEADLSTIPEDATLADYAVDGAAEGEYSGTKTSSLEAIAAKAAVTDGIEVAMEVNEELMGSDDEAVEVAAAADSAEGEAAAENPENTVEEKAAEAAKAKPNKVKVFRKMPKRYPKFMLREIPETPEGIAFENFRIIAKWLLLFARQAEMTDYISSPEYILVDMPEDKRFVLDKMNEEQGKEGLQFKPFTAADKLPDRQRSNPELAGCLYAKQFNKNHNF